MVLSHRIQPEVQRISKIKSTAVHEPSCVKNPGQLENVEIQWLLESQSELAVIIFTSYLKKNLFLLLFFDKKMYLQHPIGSSDKSSSLHVYFRCFIYLRVHFFSEHSSKSVRHSVVVNTRKL